MALGPFFFYLPLAEPFDIRRSKGSAPVP